MSDKVITITPEFLYEQVIQLQKEIAEIKKELKVKPKLGFPKYRYGDVVSFDIIMSKEKGKEILEGYVFIVDKWGTFEQNEEPSYDVYVPEMNMLFKHLRESGVKFVRKSSPEELELLEKSV